MMSLPVKYSDSIRSHCRSLSLVFMGVCLSMMCSMMCACRSVGTSVDQQIYELEKSKYVTVYLDGDVKSHGWRQIRRELSKESILEAAGGFANLSQISPKSITLKRGTQKYKIRF